MVRAICVDPDEIDKYWPSVSALIESALSGFPTLEKIETDLSYGLNLLWLAVEGEETRGVAVTGLVGDACEIIAAAGTHVDTWLHLITDIERYARAEECSRVRIIGRKGWLRMLPEYKQTNIILERPL